MDLLFNKKGVPLVGFGREMFVSTTGAPTAAVARERGTLPVDTRQDLSIAIDNLKISPWGTDNNFPVRADAIIGKVGVLNTGLRFIRNVILGQGIFPCRVKGYDDDGNEQLEIVRDNGVLSFVNSRMVRRYLEKASRDFLKLGCAFPELVPNAAGNQMVGLNAANAIYSRYTVANSLGEIEKCVVSGKWPDIPSERADYSVIPVLGEYDPTEDLNRMRLERKLKSTVIHPLRDSWSNKDYYSAPIWWSTMEAGWLDIALLVPRFLKRAYENQISWKWHVKIPYTFWDRKFPAADFKDTAERKTAIDGYMDKIEQNLCGPENANKPIFTFFEMGPNGKAEEQWAIEALTNKQEGADQLITSAASNSEILFSLMINPNVLGAGMPGGTYAGNQGGSNIREAYLVNIANAWIDRQNLLDPIEAFLRFNGVQDIELRFRNTVLTTLDTGAGTKKVVS